MDGDMSVRIGTLLVALTIAVSACSGTDEIASGSFSPREAQTSSPQPEPELPEITTVRQAGGDAIPAPASADWVLGARLTRPKR
jgi:hypothetical protein